MEGWRVSRSNMSYIINLVRRCAEDMFRSSLYPVPQEKYTLENLCDEYNAEVLTHTPYNEKEQPLTALLLRPHGKFISYVYVYSHANGENLEHAAHIGAMLRDALGQGVAVLVYEYTGYAKPDVLERYLQEHKDDVMTSKLLLNEEAASAFHKKYKPSETELYLDARAVAAVALQIKDREEYKGAKIVSFGRSLGGAMAVRVARCLKEQCAALVLLSTFTSALATMLTGYSLDMLHWLDLFRLKDDLSGISSNTSLLVIHGTADELVSPNLADKIYEASPLPERKIDEPGPKKTHKLLLGHTHNSPTSQQGIEEVASYVKRFIKTL